MGLGFVFQERQGGREGGREGGRDRESATYCCSLLEKSNNTTGAGGAVNPIIALAELTKGEKKKPWEFWKNDPK